MKTPPRSECTEHTCPQGKPFYESRVAPLERFPKASVGDPDLKPGTTHWPDGTKVFDPEIFRPDKPASQGGEGGKFILVVGLSKSGKTTVLRWILSHFHRYYARPLVMTSTAFNGSYQEFIPESRVLDHYSPGALEAWLDDQKAIDAYIRDYPKEARKSGLKPNSPAILDDVMGIANLRDDDVMDRLTTTVRHYNGDCFLLLQDIVGLNRKQRDNVSAVISFDQGRIGREHLYRSFLDKVFDSPAEVHEFWGRHIGGKDNAPSRRFIVYERNATKAPNECISVGRVPVYMRGGRKGKPAIPRFMIELGEEPGEDGGDDMDDEVGGVDEEAEGSSWWSVLPRARTTAKYAVRGVAAFL